MSGSNKHYLPRFFQGYFFNPENLRGLNIKSYKKIDYGELYISVAKKRELIKENEVQRFSCLNKKYNDILINSPPKGNKNNNNFRYTGSYNEFFAENTDLVVTKKEYEELKILQNIENNLINCKGYSLSCSEKKNIYDMLRNFYFRNKIVKNTIEYIVWDIIDNSEFKKESNKNILATLMIENFESKNKVNGFSGSKYYFNYIAKKIMENGLNNNFEYIHVKIIKVEDENLILTENVIYSMNESGIISLISLLDFEDAETLAFLLNKNNILLMSKKSIILDKVSGIIINDFLCRNSTEFILSEKEILNFPSTSDIRINKNFYDKIECMCFLLLTEHDGYIKSGLSEKQSLNKVINDLEKKVMFFL